MVDDNLGNFHDPDKFGRHGDNEDAWKPENVFGNELFRKSIEILNLAETICSMLPAEDGEADFTSRLMLENATIVPAKIKGAMAMDVYSLKMENAVIVKVNIMELKAQLWSCETIHDLDKKYLNVLYDEIEAFRQIFIKWVTSFDKNNDLPDEWHLFNDPSTFPEDDEPFDPQSFFEDFDPDGEK